jgi:hypothetical protein
MYHFLQFRADKKQAWQLYDEAQLPDLPNPAAFITVLSVDKDPESVAEQGEDPIDFVKYFGPMYLDFDGADLGLVLDSTREVLTFLHTKWDIPTEYIHCWLSGQKGVHITIPAAVFGVKGPLKALPIMYREIASSLTSPFLDMGVYSCGRGRMWRCEGVARPTTGTFKVGVTYDELLKMDASQYAVLVSSPRPPLARSVPAKSLVFPKAESAFKVARVIAAKRIRAMKGTSTVPAEVLRATPGIPGCIEKLITEGDSPESNWNQAAMQLAAYIAARYSREEEVEYTTDLIDPFVTNVQSSSRPSDSERRKHVKEQLNRAFTGRMKFAAGALISVIGTPCRNCVICREDIAKGEQPSEKGDPYDPDTQIRATARGYLLMGETAARSLSNFLFLPHTYVNELSSSVHCEQRVAMVGTVITAQGVRFSDVEVAEEAWHSRKQLLNAFKGWGGAVFTGTDAEATNLYKAINYLAAELTEEVNVMIRTAQCGIRLYEGKHGLAPHYVESEGAYARGELDSPFKYCGDAKQSPTLLRGEYPFTDDEELETTLAHLMLINEPHWVAAMLGWVVACHFSEHLQHLYTQFPLLNISGNAGAGKSSTAFLLCHLNGIDYSKTDFMNVEIATFYPLAKYVSSSTTVPRLVEEVNPSIMSFQMYQKVMGLFKGAWNRAPIPRGQLSGQKIVIGEDKVTSPIVYTSEQTASLPSLRNRSIEVKLTSRALKDSTYTKHFKAANAGKRSLQRMAKALVNRSLDISLVEVAARMTEMEALVSPAIGERPRFSYQCVLFGLAMLEDTMDACELKGVGGVDTLRAALIHHLSANSNELEKETSRSEVDRVLEALDLLAESNSNSTFELVPGLHYWRAGDQLSLVIASTIPRYRGYAKQSGGIAVISEPRQMTSLLEGEVYFDRKEQHPTKEGVFVHIIDLAKLRAEKGVFLTNFQDGTEPSES